MTLYLFDIDGTLLRSGGAGKAAMDAALAQAFAFRGCTAHVSFAGRTDRAIAADLLAAAGAPPTPTNWLHLHNTYLSFLPESLGRHGGRVLPGVPELLARLRADPSVAIGLLTGNSRRGAEVKLRHFEMWDHFSFGGFGDEHTGRDDVARMALAAAEAVIGRPADLAKTWVIGDTPLDVSCARAIGARAVAVATGWHSPAELAAAGPDLLLTDLTDTSGFVG